jgi:hypothetical protein
MLNALGKEESSEGGSNLGVNPKKPIVQSFVLGHRQKDDIPDW